MCSYNTFWLRRYVLFDFSFRFISLFLKILKKTCSRLIIFNETFFYFPCKRCYDIYLKPGAVVSRFSTKYVFLKIFQYSPPNTCLRAFFLLNSWRANQLTGFYMIATLAFNELSCRFPSRNFVKKRPQYSFFSYIVCEILKDAFPIKNLWATSFIK